MGFKIILLLPWKYTFGVVLAGVEPLLAFAGASDPRPAFALVPVQVLLAALDPEMLCFEASGVVAQVRYLFAIQQLLQLLPPTSSHKCKVVNVIFTFGATYLALDPTFVALVLGLTCQLAFGGVGLGGSIIRRATID